MSTPAYLTYQRTKSPLSPIKKHEPTETSFRLKTWLNGGWKKIPTLKYIFVFADPRYKRIVTTINLSYIARDGSQDMWKQNFLIWSKNDRAYDMWT